MTLRSRSSNWGWAVGGAAVTVAVLFGCSDADTAGDDHGGSGAGAPSGSGSGASTSGMPSGSGGGGGAAPNGECAAFYPDRIEGFYAAPDGSPDGDGSKEKPWDLVTALAQPESLQPGDTLWLRGGVYGGSFTSALQGDTDKPITVRSYPDEWAVIDGGPSQETTFSVGGAWTIYRDFEVTNSNRERYGGRPEGAYVTGPNLALVNLVIHDTGNNGFWETATELELYGCLIYENGYDDADRAHGHGVYTQNAEGRKHIRENAIFNGYSFGIHAYTEGGSIKGFDFVGNIWFGSGVAAAGVDTLKDNCLVGGLQPAAGILLQENIGWADDPSTRSVQLGYSDPNNVDVTLASNVFAGVTTFSTPWQSITMTDNTFFGAVSGVDHADYPGNEFDVPPPAEATVIIRPNQYEEGRAHVAVFNWSEADTVSVDLGDLLPIGTDYEIRNIQNYFAAPVVAGTYDGKPISLPMSLEPVQPVGVPDAIADEEKTGKRFNAFVVLPRRCPIAP